MSAAGRAASSAPFAAADDAGDARRGHVQRVPHPGDGRSYRVQLTTEGRAAHLAAGLLFQPVLEEVTRRVGRGVADTHRRLRDLHRVVTSGPAG